MYNQKSSLYTTRGFGGSAGVTHISFYWFLERGFRLILEKFSRFHCKKGKDEIFIEFSTKFYKIGRPARSLALAQSSRSSYMVPIYVNLRWNNLRKYNVSQDISLLPSPFDETHPANTLRHRRKVDLYFQICLLPLLTKQGFFYINGVTRVVLTQLIRGPGIYYSKNLTPRKSVYIASLVPTSGPWLRVKLTTLKKQATTVKSLTLQTRTQEIPLDSILYASGLTSLEILESVHDPEAIFGIISPETCQRKSIPKNQLYASLFDQRNYNLAGLGRRQFNAHLSLDLDSPVLTGTDLIKIVKNLQIYAVNGHAMFPDMDHIGNKRTRSLGEMLQGTVEKAFARHTVVMRSRITNWVKPTELRVMYLKHLNKCVTSEPFNQMIREFFTTNPLSQFMDQINPLSELTHRRKLSLLGPGGLSRDQARSVAVRTIHPTQVGRICPAETGEGQNAGLVSSLSSAANIDGFGLLRSPYLRVYNRKVSKIPLYLTAHQDEISVIASPDSAVKYDTLPTVSVQAKFFHVTYDIPPDIVEYIGLSPVQNVALGISLAPFLEHNEVTRALMASNMQRQALPLIFPTSPIIATGSVNAGAVQSLGYGKIMGIRFPDIYVKDFSNNLVTYTLTSTHRLNQGTNLHQRAIVTVNEKIGPGQTIADSFYTDRGELSLGQNILVAYMPWDGYNFEDAVLISERLIVDNSYTSMHIEDFICHVKYTELGLEEITPELPGLPESDTRHLTEDGFVALGTWVDTHDILVGKITPFDVRTVSPPERLLRAVMGLKDWKFKNVPFRLPPGQQGRVVRIQVHIPDLPDWKTDIVNITHATILIQVAQKRVITVGDKVAGRHGNKGVISKILPVEDMPHLLDGTIVDMVLNPLGVPSRMNLGQVYECLLGWAADTLGLRIETIPFDEGHTSNASYNLIHTKLAQASILNPLAFSPLTPGKSFLIDGRTGLAFHSPVTVGKPYFLKLVHKVSSKIHARSTGPYAIITQQPLRGRRNAGGQRLGEMEVWALQAYGASYTLQELLTIKSDDLSGRKETSLALMRGQLIPKPGIPETFRLLIRELQSLGLDIASYCEANTSRSSYSEIPIFPES